MLIFFGFAITLAAQPKTTITVTCSKRDKSWSVISFNQYCLFVENKVRVFTPPDISQMKEKLLASPAKNILIFITLEKSNGREEGKIHIHVLTANQESVPTISTEQLTHKNSPLRVRKNDTIRDIIDSINSVLEDYYYYQSKSRLRKQAAFTFQNNILPLIAIYLLPSGQRRTPKWS